MDPLPRGRRHQGPRRRLRRGDRAPGDRQAAAARLPRKARVRLRRHHARRQPEEVLDLRLPEVARQGQAGGRWRGPDARRPEERGRGRGGGPGGPALRVQGRRGCQPDRRGGGRPPVDQGLRLRAGRSLLGRGRRLHEVPFRKAGHGLFRPRAESEVEWRLRAARGQRAGNALVRKLAVEVLVLRGDGSCGGARRVLPGRAGPRHECREGAVQAPSASGRLGDISLCARPHAPDRGEPPKDGGQNGSGYDD